MRSTVLLSSDFTAFPVILKYPNNNKDIKIRYIQGDFTQIDLPANKFDTIIALNVLEHMDREKKALQNINKGLAKGGFTTILVPAFKCLKGSIDERLGHHRRYNKDIAKRLMQKMGLYVVTMRYYNIIGFLGWLINFRVLKREQQLIRQVVFFDKYIFPIQMLVEKFTPWQPLGQSLFIVSKKL